MTTSATASAAGRISSPSKAKRVEQAKQAATQLADRVVAKAEAVRAAERATKASTRSKRRRGRAQHVSLAKVTLGRDLDVEVVERRVDDPWPDPERSDPLSPPPKIPAQVNRRVDILEQELGNRRIDEAQYRTGRIVQAVFERAQGRVGGGGWNAGDKVDAALAHELAVIHSIETAEKVEALMARIDRAIGTVGSRFLRRILVDRVSLEQYALERGKSGERGKAQVAAHFRFLLEDLAEAWAARGSSRAERDADPWTEPPADNPKAVRRSTNRAADTLIRGERSTPLPGEEVDVGGVVVPPGKGYQLARDPEARWTPPSKRKRLEREAREQLKRAERA